MRTSDPHNLDDGCPGLRGFQTHRRTCRTTCPLTDPRLCAAIVDRLTLGANIIETGTGSYRLAHAQRGA
jgi:hypothetical protein